MRVICCPPPHPVFELLFVFIFGFILTKKNAQMTKTKIELNMYIFIYIYGQVLEEMKRVAAKVPSDVREFEPTPDFAKETVEATCKYMNYMDRQIKEMEGYRKNQDLRSVCRSVGLSVCRYVGMSVCRSVD